MVWFFIIRLFFKHNEYLSQIFIVLKKVTEAKGCSGVHHFTMGKLNGFFVLCLLKFSNIFMNINIRNRSGLSNKLLFGLETNNGLSQCFFSPFFCGKC